MGCQWEAAGAALGVHLCGQWAPHVQLVLLCGGRKEVAAL